MRVSRRVSLLHDRDAGCVKLVDHPLRGNTDSANKDSSLVPDDDFREFRQLTTRVVVLGKK